MDLSPASPDDLAVFVADALETDELKALDARLDGVDSPEAEELGSWREVLGGLAAPAGLRERILDAALAKRAVGAPIGEVEEIPADEAYGRTVAALGQLLIDLTPAEWDAPTIEGWTVKGLVTHLVAVEEYFGRQLGLWPLEIDEALEADHLGMTRAFVAAWSERPAPEVLGRWQELTGAITTHLSGLDRAAGRQPFHFHFLDTSLSTVLITRVFEIWTHDEDIRRATGRAACAPDAARLRRMSRIAVPSIPFGLAMGPGPGLGRDGGRPRRHRRARRGRLLPPGRPPAGAVRDRGLGGGRRGSGPADPCRRRRVLGLTPRLRFSHGTGSGPEHPGRRCAERRAGRGGAPHRGDLHRRHVRRVLTD